MATSLYKAQETTSTCDEHEHEELSCFCNTCEKFICTKCAKTEHHGHDWDLVWVPVNWETEKNEKKRKETERKKTKRKKTKTK